MKLKIIGTLVLLVVAAQSCKKVQELKNELVDAYWKNIEGVVLEFNGKEAYVIDAGTSHLDSDPAIFNSSTMPYFRGLVQTGSRTYSGEVVRTSYTNGKLSAVNYENTTITVAEENGNLVIHISNADATATSWSKQGGTGSTPPTPVVRDTTTTMLKDTAGMCRIVSSTSPNSPSIFKNFPVYSAWRPLGYVAGGYYYRMNAYVNGSWLLTLYFKEKPTADKVYNAVSGDMASQIGVGADEVGITWLDYFQGVRGTTVSVKVSGGKIVATATDVKTSKLTASYDDYLTFKIIGQ